MKQTVNLYDFREAFRKMNSIDNFSDEGLAVLFEYLEDYEESCDQEVELDVVALCCEYSELEYGEILEQYCIELEDLDEDIDEDDKEALHAAIEEFINNNTQLVGRVDGGLIFADF